MKMSFMTTWLGLELELGLVRVRVWAWVRVVWFWGRVGVWLGFELRDDVVVREVVPEEVEVPTVVSSG